MGPESLSRWIKLEITQSVRLFLQQFQLTSVVSAHPFWDIPEFLVKPLNNPYIDLLHLGQAGVNCSVQARLGLHWFRVLGQLSFNLHVRAVDRTTELLLTSWAISRCHVSYRHGRVVSCSHAEMHEHHILNGFQTAPLRPQP